MASDQTENQKPEDGLYVALKASLLDEEQQQAQQLSDRAASMAGISLTVLSILLVFKTSLAEPIYGPTTLILLSFLIFLLVARFTHQASKKWEYLSGLLLQPVAILSLTVSAVWIYYKLFSDTVGWKVILLLGSLILFLVMAQIVIPLWRIFGS